MIRYFFVGIPSLLFEPAAVVALLGCITTFFFFHKKNNPFFYITLSTICFMFFWRLSLYSLMVSSRYAAVILYPAVIFDVLFCFHVKESVLWCNRKFFHLTKSWFRILCTILPYFLLFCLIVPCIAKTLRHNPNTDYTIRLCKTLAGEIKGKNYFLYAQDGVLRIAYYTGIDIKKCALLDNKKHHPVHEALKKKLKDSKNYLTDVYFIFPMRRGEPEPDAEYLGIKPEMGKWECIHREYTSPKKNKELVLYRFIPANPNIEIWVKKIPDISPANLCRNGDFEQALSLKEREQRIAYCKKIGASDFYLTTDRHFPAHWGLGLLNQLNGKFSEMALTEKRAIAGKYSMELNSVGNFVWRVISNPIPKQDCIFSGFIRAESESSVEIQYCYWNNEKKKTEFIDTNLFHLQSGKTYRFSFPVHVADVPENGKSIFIIIMGRGHILLDNVECINNQTKEKR